MTDLESTQKEFDKLLSQLRSTDVESFKTFVLEALEKRSKHADDDDIDSKNALLTKIRNELKKTVNVYAEAPNEKIFYPSTGNFEGHTRKNTVHVDAFLYEDDDVLELQETGKIPINYCLDCQSRNVQPISMLLFYSNI
jgi:predicted Zn-dependent protease